MVVVGLFQGMASRKLKTDQKLEEKRDRDCAYRAKIKSDPIAYAAGKQKEHD